MQFAALPRRYKYETILGDVKTSRISKCSDTSSSRVVAVRFVQEDFYISGDQKAKSSADHPESDRTKIDRNKSVYIEQISFLLGLKNQYLLSYDKLTPGIATGRFYLPMTFVRGGSLRDWMVERKESKTPPTPVELWRLLSPVISALAYLHSNYKTEKYTTAAGTQKPIRQLYHGGVHPGNILLTEGCSTLLTDPCICRTATMDTFVLELENAQKQRDKFESIQGYLSYLAPEVLQTYKHLPASDIWSLGIIALEIFSSRKPKIPPYGPDAVDYFSTWIPPDTSSFPSEVAYFLESTLAIKPEDRITAGDLLQLPFIQRIMQEKIAGRNMTVTITACDNGVNGELSGDKRQLATTSLPALTAEDFKRMFPGEKVPSCVLKREKDLQAQMQNSNNNLLDSATPRVKETSGSKARRLKIPGNYKDTHDGLIKAIKDNNLNAVKALVRHAKSYDKNGLTAMAHAAILGRSEVVELLLPHEGGMRLKCDRDVANLLYSSPTSLMLAASEGNDAVIRVLQDCEARASTANHCRTALMAAAACGYPSIVSLLIKDEARMTTDNGTTALMLSARGGRLECVSILVQQEHGLVDRWGNSALVLAAVNGHMSCVDVLAEYEGEEYARRAISLAPEANKEELTAKLLTYISASPSTKSSLVIV
ncbi:Kinase, STE STE20 [Giardia lamblia P15]|uniref:Kinase, STE STE20 n=1 Tax=Giardia intestinalis (strain P15) TaxID=658858 RepID=E1F0Y1_GIAIA|nr:Kinase, STE STE20 [Giardia lamblia P15]